MTKSMKRQKRRKTGGAATLMRAIILEGFGIIVLIFLLTVSGTESVSANTESNQRPVLQRIRNWLDQSWSAFGADTEKSENADESSATRSVEESADPYPMNEYNSQRQFKVKRAVGYEY